MVNVEGVGSVVQAAVRVGGTLIKKIWTKPSSLIYIVTQPLNSYIKASCSHFPVLVGFYLVCIFAMS